MISIKEEFENYLKDITFIDLFSGIGGFRIAMESFGAHCAFSSEIDSYAIKTYVENFKDIPTGDITKVNEKQIPYHDVLCAGFPCQPFSISGKQEGFNDIRGTLFFDIARIVNYRKPPILLLENVSNLERHDNGRTMSVIVKTLEKLKYNVFYKVLNASNYGIPQSRKRIYIACFRKDLYSNINFTFPEGIHKNVCIKDILLPKELTEKYIINRDDIIIKEKSLAQQTFIPKTYNRPVRVGTINKGGQGERIYSIFGHGITLSATGGGAAAKTGAYLVDGLVRKLAPRECARLMGFPDTFKIVVSDNQAWKQFGNSVVIDVLQYIIKSMIEQGVFDILYKKGGRVANG